MKMKIRKKRIRQTKRMRILRKTRIPENQGMKIRNPKKLLSPVMNRKRITVQDRKRMIPEMEMRTRKSSLRKMRNRKTKTTTSMRTNIPPHLVVKTKERKDHKVIRIPRPESRERKAVEMVLAEAIREKIRSRPMRKARTAILRHRRTA